jgi:hypothetical protein
MNYTKKYTKKSFVKLSEIDGNREHFDEILDKLLKKEENC